MLNFIHRYYILYYIYRYKILYYIYRYQILYYIYRYITFIIINDYNVCIQNRLYLCKYVQEFSLQAAMWRMHRTV